MLYIKRTQKGPLISHPPTNMIQGQIILIQGKFDNVFILLACLLYPRIYAEGYIAFAFPFVCSFICLFVRSLLSVMFVEFTSKFLVKVSLSEYISLTTHQKAFIFEPWVPERVIFYAMSFSPRVHASDGANGQNLGHCQNVFFTNVFWNKLKQIVCQTWLNLQTLLCRS